MSQTIVTVATTAELSSLLYFYSSFESVSYSEEDLAERLDCRTPDCRVYLDQVCPTKQQCTLLCGQIWSCYYCFILVDYCKTLDICPNAGALHCPDFTCPGCGCHCALRMPECSHISCLCFECGRPES
ncbi:hypothetical protein EMCRGX_G018798 [Ephydatia muelleri]